MPEPPPCSSRGGALPESSALSSSAPVRRLVLLAALGLAFAVSSGDRALLAVLKTTLAQLLGFSQADYSRLVAALLLPYALMLLAAGWLINRIGPRAVLTAGLVVMSAATALSATATLYRHLLLAQVALGLAQACVAPTAAYVVVTVLPPARQAVGYSAVNAIQSAATILCPIYAAAVTLAFGWQYAFLFLSIAGLVMAAVWWLAARDLEIRTVPDATRGRVARLSLLWHTPALRTIILARIITDPFWFFFQFWQTAFLQERIGASLQEIGRFAWIPPCAGVVAVFVAGTVSDGLIRRGWSATRARLAALLGASLLSPAALALPSAGSLGFALVLCALLYALCAVWLSLTAVLFGAVAPRPLLAPALGVTAALGCLSGIGFNLLAGPLVDQIGYAPLFAVGAVLHPLAFLLLRQRLRDPDPGAPASGNEQA